MINVGIIDDSQLMLDTLKSYFQRYSKENHVLFHIRTFVSAISFLNNYKPNYDLIFMDIELPGMNGLEAAHKLRKMDDLTTLIFVTNMSQYAVKGYEVQAFDFIVKPIKYSAFAIKVTRALEAFTDRELRKLKINTQDKAICIDINKLMYIEINNHHMIFHTENHDYEVYGTLKTYEQKLSNHFFRRCNNCYLVNLRFVKSIEDNYAYVGKDKLYISRPKKTSFIRDLNNYLGAN